MDNGPSHFKLPPWFWIATIWLGIGLFDAMQTIFSMRAVGMHHAWIRLFWTLWLSWLPLALATPWILRLGRRYPPVRLRPFSTWLIHFCAATAICLVAAAWIAGMVKLLNPWAYAHDPGSFLTLWLFRFLNGLAGYLLMYTGVLAVSYGLESRERLARQDEQLSKAQLSALRRQIEPHFLFNTLNAIAGLVREGRNEAAVGMIATLGDLLRKLVDDSSRHEVALGEEMELLQKYLDIQKMRLADRLDVQVNVPTELYPAQVPSFILQPMVENAIQHGIAKRAQGGTLRISASRSNGMLNLSVYNDGPAVALERASLHAGVGITNARTRLESLYGSNFALNMNNQKPEGVEVVVSLPFRER